MPRSGTTWIGKIFDSDPSTLYMHEPDSWERLDFLPLFPDESISVKDISDIKAYIQKLPIVCSSEVTSKLPVFRKNYQSFVRFNQYKASIYLVSILRKLNIGFKPDPTARIGTTSTPFTLVWKSIESLGRLKCLLENIDNTIGIQIVRNPAGYIASVLDGEKKHSFRGTIATSDDYELFKLLLASKEGLKLGLTIDDLKSMDPVERLAIRWRLYNEIAFNACKANKNYQLLRYEDVCRNPESVAKALFSFCGLEWSSQTEKFISASTSQQNDSYYAVYKDPLKAAYRWKEKLTNEEINKIQTILKDSPAYSWYKEDFSPH